MSFLDKGSLSIVVIILIAIVIGFAIGFGSFFYWHKTYVPADNPPENISREEIKAKCLENVSKMTDEELINEVKNFKNSNKISVFAKENLLSLLYKNMINYLICKVEYDRGEENYNRAKNFMESLTYTSEKNKQSVLDRLDNVYFNKSKNTFTIQLALGDWNDICPDKLSSDKLDNLCLADLNANNIDNELFLGYCKNTCDMIEQYYCENTCDTIKQIKQYKGQDTPSSQVINIEEWANPNDTLLYQAQYRIRTAVAYHFGGQDLALEVCDNVNDSEKDKCLEWVGIMNNLENRGKKCNDVRKKLEEMICQLPIDENE